MSVFFTICGFNTPICSVLSLLFLVLYIALKSLMLWIRYTICVFTSNARVCSIVGARIVCFSFNCIMFAVCREVTKTKRRAAWSLAKQYNWECIKLFNVLLVHFWRTKQCTLQNHTDADAWNVLDVAEQKYLDQLVTLNMRLRTRRFINCNMLVRRAEQIFKG